MGRGIEIAPPCGLAPAGRIAFARISAAGRAFAIENEIDGEAIRLSLRRRDREGVDQHGP